MNARCGNRFESNHILYETIASCVSSDRMDTYLKASGHNQERALELYFWNMRMSASFYPLLASVEICLRNSVVPCIESHYGPEWWAQETFHTAVKNRGKGILLRAQKDILRRGKAVTSGQMTAELSFGFWSNMLLPKYENLLWYNFSEWFPYKPEKATLEHMRTRSEHAKALRNRIFHHEPIIGRNLTQDYSQTVEFLKWLSPEKEAWIRPKLAAMKVLRLRP